MNHDPETDGLLSKLEVEPSAQDAPKMIRLLRPGEVDAVQVQLVEDEVARVAAASPDALSEVIQAILS
jgi:uncharacterized protein YajQ (UPF0234 family)